MIMIIIYSWQTMAILIHEFGHVLDFATYKQGHLARNIWMYQATSVYTKVNSTYYEYSFYEYLIKNNIYKEEVLLNLSNSLASYTGPFSRNKFFKKCS